MRFLIAVALLAATPACAQPVPAGEQPVDPYVQSNANAGAAPFAGREMFEAFHGQAGIDRIVDDFVERDRNDPRIKDIFATTDFVRFRRTLKEQFCYILGGGCTYTGRDMLSSHKDLGSQRTDFNAIVENLQAAMDKEGVAFRAQNRFLAKLAPMERTTVER